MRAAVTIAFGGEDQIEVMEWPAPEPGAGEVLVRVGAAAINPIDAKLREGRFRLVFRIKPPYIGGFDFAGEVEALGEGVRGLAAGDIVFGSLAAPGAHAERVCAPADLVLPVPPGLGLQEAAAMPGAGLSALIALREAGALRAGKRVLLNGASGGVGTFALQIARAAGARVTAVASAGNQDLLRSLGADECVDYALEDVRRRRDAFDVFFDIAATSSFAQCRRALAPGGCYVTTLPDWRHFLWRGLSALPFFGGRRNRALMLIPRRADLEELARLAAEGQLRPVVSQVMPLDHVRDAHRLIQSGHTVGKIVLTLPPRPSPRGVVPAEQGA